MVGLPARGKSHIAKKLAYYLNWVQMTCRGEHAWRGSRQCSTSASTGGALWAPTRPPSSSIPTTTMRARRAGERCVASGSLTGRRLAMLAMDDMFEWMDKGGMVGVSGG